MALSVGDIYFTANITDLDGTGAESFSFVVTTTIAAGEVITFHSPESAATVGDTSFTFTVGAGGLSAFDRVTIIEHPTIPDTFILAEDPSGGTVSGITGNGWSITDNDNIIAAQGGQVLAAIVNSNSNGSAWDANLSVTGLSTTLLTNFLLANPTQSPIAEHVAGGSTNADNVMFSGTDITTQGSNPAFWVGIDDPVSHTNPVIGSTTYATQDAAITCFAAGSLIATPTGEQAVETLKIGDRVRTVDGALVPVLWLGQQTIDTRQMGERRQPVRIKAGALGNHSDLIVTADHGMVIDGLVINASALANGDSIDWVPLAELGDRFTVYHIETEAHDVILANGAASESYVDVAGRAAFDNYREYLDLYGVERIIPEMKRHRITTQRLLTNVLKIKLGITTSATDAGLRQAG